MDALLATLTKWALIVLGIGGTSAAVAYSLFKWLGQNWLEPIQDSAGKSKARATERN
jgi:hypothetical protein